MERRTSGEVIHKSEKIQRRKESTEMELGNMLFGNSREKHSIDRDLFQDLFCKWLAANGFDSYVNPQSSKCPIECKEENGDHYYENDVFVLRPYYWGLDESISEKPNFVYKPTGLQLSWYKYPMRDAYSNIELELEGFKTMLADCSGSLNIFRKREVMRGGRKETGCERG